MEIVLTTFAKEDIFSFPVANETAKTVPTIATTISIFTTRTSPTRWVYSC